MYRSDKVLFKKIFFILTQEKFLTPYEKWRFFRLCGPELLISETNVPNYIIELIETNRVVYSNRWTDAYNKKIRYRKISRFFKFSKKEFFQCSVLHMNYFYIKNKHFRLDFQSGWNWCCYSILIFIWFRFMLLWVFSLTAL